MAAYASLVSLMHTIDQIVDHGRYSFSLNQEQIESLQERAAFLVDFLEQYSHGDNKEVEGLESQITDASHAAEDLIESKIVDYIHENQSTSVDEKRSNSFCQQLQKVIEVVTDYIRNNRSTSFEETNSNPFCQQLQKVIEVIDLIRKKAMKIKEKWEVKDQLTKDSIPSSSSSSLLAGKEIMVGFDDVLIHIMDRLTRQQSKRLVIPIYGMGGIGKTTLTRNIYENPYIVHHFDIRAWVTISQAYEIKEIISNLLCEFGVLSKESTQGMNENQLGEKLHKYLFGRKYLIVMDDMWSIDLWDKVNLFFPDNDNGSGIMITTRLTNMATHLGSCGLEVNFLDENQSWNLLRQKVFGLQKCCLELEEIGKKIAKNCKGLPLSIVVIAGLLAKSNMTREYWDHVAEEVNSIVSLADDGQCSKILSMSYKNLPVHLKPCFLYMGVFPEDHEINVSRLIKLWVAEGFLKPNKAKSLEEVAEEYLDDLIDRNLIMVHKQGSSGKTKACKIHDLLGDLCLREAQKEKFLCVGSDYEISEELYNERRIVFDKSKKAYFRNHREVQVFLCRSITFNTRSYTSLLGCRLIKVLNGHQPDLCDFAFNQVNLRHLSYTSLELRMPLTFLSKINKLWNLQTLIMETIGIVLIREPITRSPVDIWEMKQLRHLCVDEVSLAEPPPIAAIEGHSNLKVQTLSRISNLNLSEWFVTRIPNMKKLKIIYHNFWKDLNRGKDYCLSNLQHLHKLESLNIKINFCGDVCKTHLGENLILPPSLKKLYLEDTYIPWERMTIIGCLPNLEVLKLKGWAFTGKEWKPIEGQFLSLKYLLINCCLRLEVWDADSNHFPKLEQLFLINMPRLEKIPLGIGEIPTLRSIQLRSCRDSAVISTIDILDEQESQGNDGIQVLVKLKYGTQLMNLEERDNFKFGSIPKKESCCEYCESGCPLRYHFNKNCCEYCGIGAPLRYPFNEPL